MALIDCSECGKQISDKAAACPNCGSPVSRSGTETTPPAPAVAKRPRAVRPVFLMLVVVLLGVGFWVWRAVNNENAAPLTAGLSGALRQPQKVVNERIELNEGQSMLYSFRLNTDARVQVQVTANPKHVDVMLMTRSDAEKFREVSGRLFGGQYTYRQALSSQDVLRMDKTETLPAGEWTIVVMRPSEALCFAKRLLRRSVLQSTNAFPVTG